MEELLLRPLLVGQKLDVVDQQHVDRPVALAEGRHAVETDRVDQVVDELLRREVQDLQVRLPVEDAVADGVHQVRLAEAHAAVEEQRVVAVRRARRHGHRRGVGELVGAADDEGLEAVPRVELRQGPRIRPFVFGGAVRGAGDLEPDGEAAFPDLAREAVQHVAIALFEGAEEAFRRHPQHQLAGTLVHRDQRPEPGGELLGVQLVLKLSFETRPEGIFHECTAPEGWRRGDIHRKSTPCGKTLRRCVSGT